MKQQFQLSTGSIAALTNADRADDPERLAASDQVVLLVPGFTGSKEDFMPLLRPLATAGYRAVAIDQRGQYESGWASSPDGYQLAALAAEVCELAGQLGGPEVSLHLVGHSFGGLVSRAAVLAEPALFADLALMGSGPSEIQGQRRILIEEGSRLLAEHGMTEQGMAALWQLSQSRSRADPRYVRLAPVLDAFLRERFMATDPVSLEMMGTTLRSEPDRTALLATAGLPLLVLHGTDDDAWPPPVQAAMAAELEARYQVIDNAAHSPAVENPPATAAALIEFWQSPQG